MEDDLTDTNIKQRSPPTARALARLAKASTVGADLYRVSSVDRARTILGSYHDDSGKEVRPPATSQKEETGEECTSSDNTWIQDEQTLLAAQGMDEPEAVKKLASDGDGRKQALGWCFTLNLNHTLSDHVLLDPGDFADAKYLIYQLEIADTGQPHYQGYVEFNTKKPKRLTQVQKMLPKAHWEIRRGTAEQARSYCTPGKGKLSDDVDPTYLDGPWEHGVFVPQSKHGQTTGLNECYSLIKSGHTLVDILEKHPSEFFRYHHGFKEAIRILAPKRDSAPQIIYCYGPPGTGKSRWARDYGDTDKQYWKLPHSDWFDGYNPGDTIVIDDFGPGWMPYHYFLRLCDRYPFGPGVKGSHTSVVNSTIIITSNFLPVDWWPNIKTDSEAIGRRITVSKYFPREGNVKTFFADAINNSLENMIMYLTNNRIN